VPRRRRTPTGFTGIVGTIKAPATRTLFRAGFVGQVHIDTKKELKKFQVEQQILAHWQRLYLGRRRLPLKGRLFKVLEGDILFAITLFDLLSGFCHRDG